MVECDIIIYDITEDPEQIDEAVWAVSGKISIDIVREELLVRSCIDQCTCMSGIHIQILYRSMHLYEWHLYSDPSSSMMFYRYSFFGLDQM